MIAAFVGNHHAAARVTPFFDNHQQAREAASALGHKTAWTREIANWQQHQKWNKDRAGTYTQMPVAE